MLSRIINLCKKYLSFYLIVISVVFSIYLIIANIVFAIRHPWASQTERLFYLGDALLYKKLTYSEMRGNYE